MTHPYDIGCRCDRCAREKARRNRQREQDHARFLQRCTIRRKRRQKRWIADRTEQHGRYLDCGPYAWDDQD